MPEFYISFEVSGPVSAKRYSGCDCAKTVRLFHGRLSHGQLLAANLAISSSALCFLRPVIPVVRYLLQNSCVSFYSTLCNLRCTFNTVDHHHTSQAHNFGNLLNNEVTKQCVYLYCQRVQEFPWKELLLFNPVLSSHSSLQIWTVSSLHLL